MGRPPTIGGLAPKPLHRLASLADFQTTITQLRPYPGSHSYIGYYWIHGRNQNMKKENYTD